jgi:hypothetical protein
MNALDARRADMKPFSRSSDESSLERWRDTTLKQWLEQERYRSEAVRDAVEGRTGLAVCIGLVVWLLTTAVLLSFLYLWTEIHGSVQPVEPMPTASAELDLPGSDALEAEARENRHPIHAAENPHDLSSRETRNVHANRHN